MNMEQNSRLKLSAVVSVSLTLSWSVVHAVLRRLLGSADADAETEAVAEPVAVAVAEHELCV